MRTFALSVKLFSRFCLSTPSRAAIVPNKRTVRTLTPGQLWQPPASAPGCQKTRILEINRQGPQGFPSNPHVALSSNWKLRCRPGRRCRARTPTQAPDGKPLRQQGLPNSLWDFGLFQVFARELPEEVPANCLRRSSLITEILADQFVD